jgi:hypothetical protein
MHLSNGFKVSCLALSIVCFLAAFRCGAQIDPEQRSMLQFGYDAPLEGQGPVGVYGFYYYNNPDYFRTNIALRLAINPVYLDGEVGFKQLLSPYTDVGLEINGGGWGDDYYEIRQGEYIKAQSFYGDGGGAAASVYHSMTTGASTPV